MKAKRAIEGVKRELSNIRELPEMQANDKAEITKIINRLAKLQDKLKPPALNRELVEHTKLKEVKMLVCKPKEKGAGDKITPFPKRTSWLS